MAWHGMEVWSGQAHLPLLLTVQQQHAHPVGGSDCQNLPDQDDSHSHESGERER